MSNDDSNDRPVSPVETDCCGDGCNPCIFDVHRELVEKWNRRHVSKDLISEKKNILALTKYKSFVITERNETCVDCILIRLKYEGLPDTDLRLFLNPGQHVIMRIDPTVSRPYTPISWKTDSILLLVKLYPDGKFSKFIERMKIGDEIEVRGPYGDFFYRPNSFEDILMLSVGTGIAALYPIARSVIDDELEETRVHLIAGFKSQDHIPLANELRNLSHYWNFSCTLKLSENDNENKMNGIRLENGHVEEGCVADFLRSRLPSSTLVLICGTPIFNETATRWIENLNFTNYHVFN